MAAEQYALVHGARNLRETLEDWQRDPWPRLRQWFLVAAAPFNSLLVLVTVRVLIGAEEGEARAEAVRLPGILEPETSRV